MANPSIPMPDKLQGVVDDRRHSTTSRAAYVREAIRVRLLLEDRGEFEELLTDAPEYDDSSGEETQTPTADV